MSKGQLVLFRPPTNAGNAVIDALRATRYELYRGFAELFATLAAAHEENGEFASAQAAWDDFEVFRKRAESC